MRTALRAACRLAFSGCLALTVFSLAAAPSFAAAPPENVHPNNTLVFIKVNNAAGLRDAFSHSQIGQLWNDPALKPWRESMLEKLDDSSKALKERVGVTIRELVELPQGTLTFALVANDDPKIPVIGVLTADAGKNSDALEEVLNKATKHGEDAGSKVQAEDFKGLKLHILHSPQEKGNDGANPPLVWVRNKNQFRITSDVDTAKDFIENADGRNESLATSESFTQVQKKFGPDAQLIWYIDVNRLVKLLGQAAGNAQKNPAAGQQIEGMLQVLGINGLKALAGSVVLNTGNFDSLTKTVVLMPAPLQGVLKMFRTPNAGLRPEPWVPATVASYSTISWDLDAAFAALNEILNMVNPGILNVWEQQLVGPNGGEPLSFQKDVFGPLGNRLTLVTDYKKPIKEDSQRALLAVALSDSKAFERTLKKVIAMIGAEPKKREFQGTTIYDFELPNLAPPNGENNVLRGPMSLTIAKDTLFLSSEPTLLEQVLRGGGSTLADSPGFQEVVKEMPDQVSTLRYARPEEQARISYDMVKNGGFTKALRNARPAAGADFNKLADLIEKDKDKLPDFEVFAKYLSSGGGYSVADDDGLTFTSFTLRNAKP
jgi:hypothetical protein